jgi:hypothetical protein
MSPYVQGQYAASSAFGLTKTADAFTSGGSLLSRMGKKVKGWLPTAEGTKKFFIGEPGKFKEELASGKALSKGSLIRESLKAPGMLNKLLFYGFPALDVVSTLRSDSPDKPGDIAGILGGAAASSAMYRPLGMLGAMAAGIGGGMLGRGIVNKGRDLMGEKPPEMPQEYSEDPYRHIPYRQMYPYAGAATSLLGGGG